LRQSTLLLRQWQQLQQPPPRLRHSPQETALPAKPKPSKQARNNKKQEVKRLLAEQQQERRSQYLQPPRRLEEAVYKRLG